MKRVKYLFFLFTLCGLYQSCNIPELPGSIYGTVEDKATGEPIKSAWVELSSGEKITTGSNGAFEFPDLNPNEYTLLVTKNGYVDSETLHIDVKPNQSVKVDIQIERLPPALKVVDDNRKDIDTLDFGNAEDDVARSFNIFNDGVDTLEWQITTTAEWIKSISKTEGKLVAGAPQSIVMVIDRTILKSGLNKTSIHITSNNGNKQLVVLALNDFQPTTLNTYPVTNNKGNSATLHGEIITDGNPKYTERGFVYATSSMPTIQNTILKVTSPLTTENTYSAIISNLIEGETYYVRAYAINAKKESYSTNEVYFSATRDTLAYIITSSITDTTYTTANISGNVINDGGSTVTDRGICYSTHSNPSISDNIVPAGSGLGSFSVTLENLSAGTTYYVCAYATNEAGTSYGEIKSFTTKSYSKPTITTDIVTLISYSSATTGGNITSDGGSTVTDRGICYATHPNPSISDNVVSKGSGLGSFSVTLEKLSAGTTYYVCAYAINEIGTSYGDTKSFTTKSYSKPIITTDIVTNISYSSATTGGNITSDGGSTITNRGICYSTHSNPSISDHVASAGSGLGNFSVTLDNLSAGTTYYVCAYATNEAGTSYGEIKSFTTKSYSKPIITTNVVTNISYSSATTGGNITSDGGSTITDRGICYSTHSNPSISDHVASAGSGLGNFSVTLDNLSTGTTYYVCAYATNEAGTSYGEIKSFTTLFESPYVDLGLPSGTKWMDKNQSGYYDYDTAKRIYGLRIPTKMQWEELMNLCTWKWTGNGYMVVGLNGNYIILPADGCMIDGKLQQYGTHGKYRSAEYIDKDNATYLYFNSSSIGFSGYSSHYGYSVRLVQ